MNMIESFLVSSNLPFTMNRDTFDIMKY